jgi:hypothetical protein
VDEGFGLVFEVPQGHRNLLFISACNILIEIQFASLWLSFIVSDSEESVVLPK